MMFIYNIQYVMFLDIIQHSGQATGPESQNTAEELQKESKELLVSLKLYLP